jgi:hypothetical protein
MTLEDHYGLTFGTKTASTITSLNVLWCMVSCSNRPIVFLLTSYYLNLLLQTKLYTEDWIGLRALDEAGRVHFISVPGPHLGLSEADMKKHVIPYLNGQTS